MNTVAAELDTTADPYRLDSVHRAMAVLESLGDSAEPLSLAALCERLDLHKSTAHRVVMALEHSGMIERAEGHRYRLGMKLYELGSRAVEQIDLRERVQPHFRRLSEEVGETVHLGILRQTSVVYLTKLEPHRRICMSSKPGSTNPLYCTSLGKAMLAFQPGPVIETLLPQIRFVRHTPKTLSTTAKLLVELERVRRRGYAVDDEEIELGVRCIGAPIFAEGHAVLGAVSVSGTATRIPVQRVPAVAEHVMRCCRAIGDSLKQKPRRRPRL